jgi:hypothetical protein
MATANNPAATPEWLEEAARIEAPAATDRIALTPSSAKKIDLKPATLNGETDVHRRGYDAAALLPSTVVLGLITAGVVTFIRPFVPARWATEFVTMPLMALWAGQIIRGGYRLWAYRYELTSRRLMRRRGRLYPADEPLDLANLGRVEIRRTRTQMMLGVGDVVVVPEESSGRSPLDLPGIRWPKKFAALMESTAATARELAVREVRSSFPSAQR